MQEDLRVEVRIYIHIENDIKKIREIFKKTKGLDGSSIDEYIENVNDNYDKFWYYLDETAIPPTKLGPYTRQKMQEFKNSKKIDDFTIVWHPMIDGWKAALHVKALNKVKQEPSPEILECIAILKRENEQQPVFLKQGYLHLQKNSNKEMWKSRWVVMTKDSLQLYTFPKGKLKTELKITEITITLRVFSLGENGLVLDIGIPSATITYVFWSPFQKEIFEWGIELKKLKSLEKNVAQYIVEPMCEPDETNLMVINK